MRRRKFAYRNIIKMSTVYQSAATGLGKPSPAIVDGVFKVASFRATNFSESFYNQSCCDLRILISPSNLNVFFHKP